jgi:CheW-like domain
MSFVREQFLLVQVGASLVAIPLKVVVSTHLRDEARIISRARGLLMVHQDAHIPLLSFASLVAGAGKHNPGSIKEGRDGSRKGSAESIANDCMLHPSEHALVLIHHAGVHSIVGLGVNRCVRVLEIAEIEPLSALVFPGQGDFFEGVAHQGLASEEVTFVLQKKALTPRINEALREFTDEEKDS